MSWEDYILASIYLVLWIGTLAVYHWNRNRVDGGTMVIGLQVVYAMAAIMSFSTDLLPEHTYLSLRLAPYLILWGTMLVAISPVWYVHSQPKLEIVAPHTLVLRPLCWILIVVALLSVPSLFSNGLSGIAELFSDSQAGREAYNKTLEEAQDAGNGIENIISIILNASSELSIFLLFYYMTQVKASRWLQIGLSIVLIPILLTPILAGQRGNTIIALLTLGVAFMMWLPYMNERIRWWSKRAGVVLVMLISLPIAAITISRFEKDDMGVGGSLSWYIGQGSVYFNNYALDNNGIRYGDRTFNLVKRVIDPSTPKNYVERRAKYPQLLSDDNIFTTFVGDFFLDFGPYIGILIILLFNMWVLWELTGHDSCWQLRHMLLLYIVLCINIQGGMGLYTFADTGGLKLIVMFGLYFYLKIHDRLIAKFGR